MDQHRAAETKTADTPSTTSTTGHGAPDAGAGPVVTRLAPMTPDLIERLLAVALREADPIEVMPPVPGEAGWTEAAVEGFRAFHRQHLDGALGTEMFVVRSRGEVVGMIRLAHCGQGAAETGMWLGRSARGRGLARVALRELLAVAAEQGVRTVYADTTADNLAAQAVLRSCGATLTPRGDKVYAEFTVPGK